MTKKLFNQSLSGQGFVGDIVRAYLSRLKEFRSLCDCYSEKGN